MIKGMGLIIGGGIIVSEILVNLAHKNLNEHFNRLKDDQYDSTSRKLLNYVLKSYNCCNDQDLTEMKNVIKSIERGTVSEACCISNKLESCKTFLKSLESSATEMPEQETLPGMPMVPRPATKRDSPAEYIYTQVIPHILH